MMQLTTNSFHKVALALMKHHHRDQAVSARIDINMNKEVKLSPKQVAMTFQFRRHDCCGRSDPTKKRLSKTTANPSYFHILVEQ